MAKKQKKQATPEHDHTEAEAEAEAAKAKAARRAAHRLLPQHRGSKSGGTLPPGAAKSPKRGGLRPGEPIGVWQARDRLARTEQDLRNTKAKKGRAEKAREVAVLVMRKALENRRQAASKAEAHLECSWAPGMSPTGLGKEAEADFRQAETAHMDFQKAVEKIHEAESHAGDLGSSIDSLEVLVHNWHQDALRVENCWRAEQGLLPVDEVKRPGIGRTKPRKARKS